MYYNRPVMIPEAAGRIRFRKVKGTEYVEYIPERKYNPEKKYTETVRVLIGVRIPGMQTMMLPNGNYAEYFGEEEETVSEEEYAVRRSTFEIYRNYFDAIYFEFEVQSRRMPEAKVNRYKAEKINQVLAPLIELLKDEACAEMLGLVETGSRSPEGNGGDGSAVPHELGEQRGQSFYVPHSCNKKGRPLVPRPLVPPGDDGEESGGMSYGDVMMLLTMFRRGLVDYQRNKL